MSEKKRVGGNKKKKKNKKNASSRKKAPHERESASESAATRTRARAPAGPEPAETGSLKQAQETLRESEEQCRAIVEDIPVLICRFLPCGEITFVNKAYCEYFGKTSERLVGSTFISLIPETDRETVMANISALTVDSPTQSHEHRIIAPDGDIRWQRWTNCALFDVRGKAVAYQSIGEDITDRKQAAESLEYRMEFERVVGEISSEFVRRGVDDVDEVILHGLRDISEFTSADRAYVFLLRDNTTTLFDNTHEWCAEGIDPQIEHLKGIAIDKELPWFAEQIRNKAVFHASDVAALPDHADLEKAHFEQQNIQSLIGVPMIQGEDLVGFLGFDSVRERREWSEDAQALLRFVGQIFTNALQRKQSEKALRASEEKYRQLFATESDAIAIFDAETRRFMDVNEAAVNLYGYTKEEFLNLVYSDISEDPEQCEANIQQVIAGEQSFVPLGHHRKKDGTVFPVEISAGSFILGNRPMLCGVVRDITERKQLEAELLQAQKMEAIGLLAGGVAHDFRNQLTVIKGYGERLLRRSLVSEEGIRPVEEILKATERSAATAGQLLAFSRRELLHPKVVDLNVLVSDMAKTLPQMIGEDIRLSTAFCCTACRLNVDANQLQQAILNLVVNARHVMPAGGELAVETSRLEADESFCRRHTDTRPGPYVALSVSDTGCGMDAETLGKIFDPFFTTRRLGEGAGLGLSMVYGFVKQSGGTIEVESEPGKGSVFRLYFPRVETAAIPIGNTEVPEDIPRGDETILVVEDEDQVRKMLAVNLRDFGYTVIEAGCAAEAMPLARDYAGQIDVLVTDFVMPGMNGAELARRIGQSRPETAVLYVTGYKSAELSQHGLDGVNPRRMLIKPFSPAELSRRIRETLDPATPPTEP